MSSKNIFEDIPVNMTEELGDELNHVPVDKGTFLSP